MPFSRKLQLALILVVGGLLLNYASPYKLVFNKTESVALGLYLATPALPKKGDIALFKYNPPTWAIARGYFEVGELFLKPVVASEGDTLTCEEGIYQVCRGSECITVGEAEKTDSKGRPVIPFSCSPTELKQGEIFVISPKRKSLDSRYLGIIAPASVKGSAIPLITW